MAVPAARSTRRSIALVLAGAVICGGVLAGAVLAQGARTPRPSPAAAASATVTAATPSPAASSTASAMPSSSASAIDLLRSLVLDAASGYSGRIVFDGELHMTSDGSQVRGTVSGTVAFSGRDFRSMERMRIGDIDDERSVVVVAGRIYLRDDGGPWSTPATMPETLGIDPLAELKWSHDLDEVAPRTGADRDLVVIRWPMMERVFDVGLGELLGWTGWRSAGSRVEIVADPDGKPVRVAYDLRGTGRDDGREADMSLTMVYRYGDIGRDIAIEAPDTGD